MKHILVHLSFWFGILLFWIVVSRNNHPSFLLNCIASLTLVAASATAFYTSTLILARRYSSHHSIKQFAIEILSLVVLLDLVSVFIIQVAYNATVGPDPARFGLLANVLFEAIFIGFHLALAFGITFVWRTITKKTI